ncbi:MAG: GLPGLI family protein [Pedobacter sp.]|nr:MAG: GLPGLI family protein [Pedobacter sp.]
MKIIIACCLILMAQQVFGQHKAFHTQGVIEFEKRVNIYGLIKETMKKNPNSTYLNQMFEEYQKHFPQFKSLKSTLIFGNNGQTLFTPEEVTVNVNDNFGNSPSVRQNNTIATNTVAQTSVAQKKVYEELYLVKDSTRKINWKITNEIRNIAGYDCRRANALIMDSIYVVAFYTDEIPVSGGPESFSGLPGMILGVALPYEHTTWFATSVTPGPTTEDKLTAPSKGKITNNSSLLEILKKATKNWGDGAVDVLKALQL